VDKVERGTRVGYICKLWELYRELPPSQLDPKLPIHRHTSPVPSPHTRFDL
jgi:hypothetical protein